MQPTPQQQMQELAKAMPVLSTQLATWAGCMDARDEEIADQGEVIVTQIKLLNQQDEEIAQLVKQVSELRKQLKSATQAS